MEKKSFFSEASWPQNIVSLSLSLSMKKKKRGKMEEKDGEEKA